MPGLFEFLDDINYSKTDLVLNGDEQTLRDLDVFMLRRGLAQSLDTILIAQRMNRIPNSDPWVQWCYAMHSVKPKKRYNKWAKKSAEDETLKMLSDFFYISLEKAEDFMRFLTKAQIEEIKEKVGYSELNEKVKPTKTSRRKAK